MVVRNTFSTCNSVLLWGFVLFLKSQCLCSAKIEDDPLYRVLDECARDYVNFRVKSQGVVLKAEHYVHEVKGLRKTFYGGQVTKELQWASFYLEVLQQLEYESDFMTFLSDEMNKRDCKIDVHLRWVSSTVLD